MSMDDCSVAIWLLSLWAGAILSEAQVTTAPSISYRTTPTDLNDNTTLSSSFQSAKPPTNCSDNQILVDFKCIDSDLKGVNSSLVQFLAVALLSVMWIIYITFFNSRLIGYILTAILNQFVKDGYLKIGSFSFSVLSGKIMFRDVQYITPDSSIFIYDGYCIFRWWRPYKFSPWRKKRDLSEGHTRLTVSISGLEYHVYNRSDVYSKLEELFGLDSQVFISKSKAAKQSPKKSEAKESQKIAWWRSLIPVIKISVSYGKVIFGNQLLPSTLVISYEDANTTYNTTKASNKYDLFMHVMDGTLGSLKVMLVPSPKYETSVLPPNRQAYGNDPAPRKMSEGYDLITSSMVSFKYMWDEPGKTGMPLAQSKFAEYHAKTNDADFDDDNAIWELEVRCKSRVVMNYGPWADRQINHLWRFYYPYDYQKQQVTSERKHEEIRAPIIFNLYINLEHDSEIDLLYLKNDDPGAIHISVTKGSCIEMHVPMTVSEDGFMTQVSGQLIYPDATTSMPFRPLLSAEMLSFNVTAKYPLIWNDQQSWVCDIKASKASASLLFEHKNFLANLMDDWSNRESPDLLSFIPYKMKLSFDLQDFELVLPANEHNWLDCATKKKENAFIALTGKSLKIDFTLPFHSFLAPTYMVPFVFQIKRAELCLFVPESNSSRHLLLNLSKGLDAWHTGKSNDGNVLDSGNSNNHNNSARSSADVQEVITGENYWYENSHRLRKDPKWGFINEDWVKCWDAPEMGLTISYTWHPVLPTRKEDYKHSRETDLNKEIEKVDKFIQRQTKSTKKLSVKKTVTLTDSSTDIADPLLGSSETLSAQSKSKSTATVMFDPTSLDPDEIRVDFVLKPGSTLFLYGSLLHHFIAIKENYLGVNDIPTDFTEGQQKTKPKATEQNSNPLYYRTLQVTVNVNLHNVRGVLPVHMNPAFKSYPTVRLKLLAFEMDKNYNQTRLQLLLSKLAIGVEENMSSNVNLFDNQISRKGWLMLTDLQLRGHAMFSGSGLPLGAVTIEYGWLTEVLVGPVIGKLSVPQIQLLVQWAQTFVFLLKNDLQELKPAYPERYLPTGIKWEENKQDGTPISEGDVKFLMAQIKLESIKLRVEEKDSALDIAVSPVLISNGNIQHPGVKEAASIRVKEVLVKQRIRKTPNHIEPDFRAEDVVWVEAGEVRFGSLHTTITVATPEREMRDRQNKFLKFHDKKTRRLHFLWQDYLMDMPDSGSALSSVQSLKSWGCNFFTPVTSKHPTYFYKSRKTPPRKPSRHDGQRSKFIKTLIEEEDSDVRSSSRDDDDSSDRDSDVFDPHMEYGMSLLNEGRCLLSRSRTISLLSKRSSVSVDSAPCDGEEGAVSTENRFQLPAGEVLTTHHPLEEPLQPMGRKLSRPGLKRQEKITSSTGNINTDLIKGQARSSRKSSAFRKSRSKTVDESRSFPRQNVQPQVSFAPSPEKLSALKRSSSQTDIDVIKSEETKQVMRRALSSDSNLYRSAESDFKSTTSLSSDVADEFYSAESDVNETETKDVGKDVSPSNSAIAESPEKVSSQIRPGTLVLNHENSASAASTMASTESQPPTTLSPSFTRSLSMSPVSVRSTERSNQGSKSPPLHSQPQTSKEILACYERHLTLLRMTPVETKSKKIVEVEEQDFWFDDDLYVLPGFTVIRDGVHPSVMVDRDSTDVDSRQLYKMESANRELSFEELDSSGKSTNVSVYLRESLDVQLTPFLLKTVRNIVDAATPVIKHENPNAVISQLEIDCLSDAAERLPEDAENMKNDGDDKDKSKLNEKGDKQRPSLKRQKRMEGSTGSLSDDNKAKPSGPTVTRPLPGTKLSVQVDRVRINILQATLGDDKIFSLRSSKLLPTPCVTILATRLESLNVSVDLNSRRKNRLLMENLRKSSRTSSSASDKKNSLTDPPNLKKCSTSSDMMSHKHFLVLLNAKATAKSVALQMRAMTCDGSVPDMTSITALADKDCKAPFEFNPNAAPTAVKELVNKYNEEMENGTYKRKISRYQASGPPKLWGWVMLEAGVDRVRLNVIKQVPVRGTKDLTSFSRSETYATELHSMDDDVTGAGETSVFHESVHVHFADETINSNNNAGDSEWALQDANLHASQGELFIGSVWINMLSPSAENIATGRSLRTWNLLSCVSSSIMSWLDPADRLATSVTNFIEEKLTRTCAVSACILTAAFEISKNDIERIMDSTEMKYDMLTMRAKLLRKDLNLLLCHELQRFLSTPEGRAIVFAAVGPNDASPRHKPELPALSTLKKGVSAMLRQWTSHFSSAIYSVKGKSRKNSMKKTSVVSAFETVEFKNNSPRDAAISRQSSLVLEVEAPNLQGTQDDEPMTIASMKRQPRPVVVKKSATVTSLSAIDEVVSSGSGNEAERAQSAGVGTSNPDPKSTSERKASKMSSAEEVVMEQQKSMYSWMSNARKADLPLDGSQSPDLNASDIESQNLIPHEVTPVEKTTSAPNTVPTTPQEKHKSNSKASESKMEMMNFEEVFQIFLRNVGLDVDSPVTIKSAQNVSFIRGECLGSLSVNAKLKLFRVDKQEADPMYNLDGQARRKRKSSKTRKPRSYYNSLEHARELRDPHTFQTTTWPHMYLQKSVFQPPPILKCQDIEIKSSIIEDDLEDGKKVFDKSMQNRARSPFGKNRTTLNVGARLSVDNIVQHVDIALIRLIHQFSQISDTVQQAKTDIQVNKYTEGSASPDFKVIHRHTISNVSDATNEITTVKRQNSQTHSSVSTLPKDDNDHVEDNDADAVSNASTASTEVPHCWQIMYKMVDLYDSLPENKMEALEKPPDSMHMENENSFGGELTSAGSVVRRATVSLPPQDPYLSLVLKATAGVRKVEAHAAFGDLKLHAEILDLVTEVDHTKEALNIYKTKAASKFNTKLQGINMKLIDQGGRSQNKEPIATASVKSSTLDASTNHQRDSSDNIVSLHLGLISFDLFQGPASLHDVVLRSSRQLSAHISEFAQTPSMKQSYHFDHTDSTTPYFPATPAPSSTALPPMTPVTPSTLTALIDLSQDSSSQTTSLSVNVQFVLESDGICIVASLLPSLHAEYKTGPINGDGRTGLDALFSISLIEHVLKFTTTNSAPFLQLDKDSTTEIFLPEIVIDGEYKQADSDGAKQKMERWKTENYGQGYESTSTQLQVRSGDYLSISVNIGSFEHSLTTDLLNQLIFLQEVFLTEINDMIDKVQKTNKPTSLWSDTTIKSDETSSLAGKPLLYQLKLSLKGIQITAATPSCNAVRLKTGEMMFELSNRVIDTKATKKKSKKKKGLNVPKYLKLFGKAQVDLTLSLGTLVRNTVYPEAEDDFQQLAYFTTRIGLQNTRQGKDEQTGQARGHSSATNFSASSSKAEEASIFSNSSSHSIDDRLLNPQGAMQETENSVVLISLTRPLFFIQPTAFDKAILVYLSYKNAYEDWKEQQKKILKAAMPVIGFIQSARSRPTSQTSLPRPAQQRTSTVFLQLSVNDLGICLPVAQTVQLHEVTQQDELPSALVLTINNTLISAYYSRSLVTKGLMRGFCLRFADDFQTSWDDWKSTSAGSAGDLSDPSCIMNALVVPEGTYEICSDTNTYHSHLGGPPVAKTTVNVLWKMKGMDVHFDTKIGSYFSKLTETLMAITGTNEQGYDEELDIETSQSEDDKLGNDEVDGGNLMPRKTRSATTSSTTSSQGVPLDFHLGRTRKIEHELNEQVKIVNDLKQLGAKQSMVQEEEKRMHELEAALSSNFRKIFKSRLRRSSLKSSSKKESFKKFKPSHQRAKSATVSPPGEVPPRPSHSAYSTLPYRTEVGWAHPVRDSYSTDAVGYRNSMPSELSSASPHHPSPLTYDSDHVFPPTPDKNYGRRAVQHSDESDEDLSSGEDEVDANMSHANVPPVRRSLYSDRYNSKVTIPSSKSDSNLVNMSQTASGPEAELQLELEIKAVVDGGKIECHPQPEEVDVTVKPDYAMMPRMYASSKARNLVRNTTIFYIPGLDVKVHYNSAMSVCVDTIAPKETKEEMFSFSPKAMETVVEQNESLLDSSGYTTPPVTLSQEKVKLIKQLAVVHEPEKRTKVPDIEITTPSHFAGKNSENIFFTSDQSSVKISPESRRPCIQAWLNLQSLPEMVISPYLLDFVEQTLIEVANLSTPAQSFSQKQSSSSSRQGSIQESLGYSDDEASDLDFGGPQRPPGEGSVLSSESPLVSLPLDVVVQVNVQPSQVRFNCVPMSRVECLLQIPSIDLSFSSIQEDINESLFVKEDDTDKKTKSDEESKLDQSAESTTTGNQTQKGLNFSAALSDFSVYVFHPYGGIQQTGSSFPLDMSGSFSASPAPSVSNDSPFVKGGSGRRDSLSVNLEFVKINLVRKRKGDTILVAEFMTPGSKSKVDNVIVHVMGNLDVGKASFKYDMRRLNEILAFPRAWYRRSIARRMFLGDTSDQTTTSSPKIEKKVTKQLRSSVKVTGSRPYAHTAPVDSSILSFLTVDSPLSPQQRTVASKTSFQGDKQDNSDTGSHGASSPAHWQALVMLEMNMSRLDVEMNMSNVMGNTIWSCDSLKSTGKLMFHSSGDRDITLACGLGSSQITARGGIIGGNIELKKFDADCRLLDPADGEPLHKLAMRAQSLDGKIEYMGGCVMMGQLTQVDFQLKDEWRDPVQSIPSNMDKGTVYVHCDLGWRVFQLSISRSTTPDVIKMLSKLEEFFSQQLHSSVRAISSWTQSHARPVSPKKAKETFARTISTDAPEMYDHRRHWPPVFNAVAEALADSASFGSRKALTNKSFLLGGSACLHGEGLTVVCFHGANFRSKSWVLFNILQPNIVFSTEVQEIEESVTGNETSTLAIQSLTVNLGHDVWLSRTQRSADPMATVSRVTRSRHQNPPPGSAAIAEWFAYMTASRNEELKMLRTLNDIGAANTGRESTSNRTAVNSPGHPLDSSSRVTYSHEADIIFALPKVQLDFKTEHIQAPNEPDPTDLENKPIVECSFVTEFTDHICVTMDVELLLFLHDLISSYLKEKQQALSSRTKLSSLNVGIWNENFDGSYTTDPKLQKPIPVDPIDIRDFICKTWQLEPTVTLISWAGRRIEPVGVDYILQKLGFQHARTTIPKWIQRGVLDLLDKGLAAIVEKLVVAIINEQNRKAAEKAE